MIPIIIFRETQGRSNYPGGSEVKPSASNAGDPGSIPGSGSSIPASGSSIPESGIFNGEGNGNPLQYSCLENPMDGGAWYATVHRVAKSRKRLRNFTQRCGKGRFELKRLTHSHGARSDLEIN